ncbi:MAG: ABC transporter substrate-binding protein [Cyanobacteriota bacterium]|nr:ABC transporter substrate-binding protein [Cyanobacteriota bacterium]
MKAAVPPEFPLNRRRFLQLAALTAAAGRSGCSRGNAVPTLRASTDTLPALWRRRLPSPWAFSPFSKAAEVADVWPPSTDLLALTDGWLAGLAPSRLQAIATSPLESQLGRLGQRFLADTPEAWSGLMLPVGFSPWVMLIRRESGTAPDLDAGWNILLDPAFEGKLLLPSSPRLLVSLADRISGPDPLRRLRAAALSFDDRFALNWLLQGEARLAVLPLQRCMGALQRDPRLMVVLPQQGAPLHWTLLLRPTGTAEPVPQAWVEEAWTPPLLPRMLSQGWIPPLPAATLAAAANRVPSRLLPALLPPATVWDACWTLFPLDPSQTLPLQVRWNASAP